jgi:hypothetical protein
VATQENAFDVMLIGNKQDMTCRAFFFFFKTGKHTKIWNGAFVFGKIALWIIVSLLYFPKRLVKLCRLYNRFLSKVSSRPSTWHT